MRRVEITIVFTTTMKNVEQKLTDEDDSITVGTRFLSAIGISDVISCCTSQYVVRVSFHRERRPRQINVTS